MSYPPANTDNDRPEGRIGAVLAGCYTLTRVLGTGGMGTVYEAHHSTTGKKVAIKLLAPQLSKDLKLVSRFRREAMAASRLDHENCVHVDDFGEDKDGTFYIAMELVSGHGLGDELRATGPMAAGRVARIGVQLFKALDAAHVGGVLHRDLKPQNVMLAHKAGRTDIVKVVDFGIAKLTNNEPGEVALTVPGTIFGTPEYMSPEQARGETLDARSDLYSASVVLWHMLLGRSPFRGTSVRDTLIKVFVEEAPSPLAERPGLALPPGFEAVLRRGLMKNRDERWPDAASYAEALMPFTEGALIDLPPRARPGLTRGGGLQAATLEKFAAVAIWPRDTVPVPVPQAPTPAVSPHAITSPSARLTLPPAPLPLRAPPPPAVQRTQAPPTVQPPTAVVAPPNTCMVLQTPVSFAPTMLSRAVTTTPFSLPSPPGQPKSARVVTVDSVARQTVVAPALTTVVVRRSRQEPISSAALVVILGGAALLVGFVVVAWLVFYDKLGTPPAPPALLVVVAPVVTETPPLPSLLGDLPLDTQARDAALGRAERAVSERRLADARTAYEEAVAADPTAPTALIGLGTMAMQQRDWAVARDCFGKLIEIDNAYRKQFGPMYARARRFAEQPPQ